MTKTSVARFTRAIFSAEGPATVSCERTVQRVGSNRREQNQANRGITDTDP